MPTKPRAVFTSMIRTIRGQQMVVVLDHANEAGSMSVTNDAEAVVRYCYDKFWHLPGVRRIVYRDTDGQWDELEHAAGVFAGFTPMPEAFVAELNQIP